MWVATQPAKSLYMVYATKSYAPWRCVQRTTAEPFLSEIDAEFQTGDSKVRAVVYIWAVEHKRPMTNHKMNTTKSRTTSPELNEGDAVRQPDISGTGTSGCRWRHRYGIFHGKGARKLNTARNSCESFELNWFWLRIATGQTKTVPGRSGPRSPTASEPDTYNFKDT